MTTALRDTRRITEHDADFRHLHQQMAQRLRASVRRYVQELRLWLTADAQRAFIARHTAILQQAYQDAHQAGAEDFADYHHSPIDTQAVLPRSARLARVLGFYLPSVAKMAREGADLHHQELRERPALAERRITRRPPPSPYDDDEYDYETYPYQQTDDTPIEGSFLDQWAQGEAMGARVMLQANVVWPGLQDGYVDAGRADGRYTQIVWDLEPSVKEHCFDCQDMAANNPYDAPGSGGNELWNTPGDGNTACGAACRCSLRYVTAPTALADVPEHYQVVRLAGREDSFIFFNANHEPAGQPNGGQFAPKGTGEGGEGKMIERLRAFLGHAYRQRYPRGTYKDMDEISANERLDAHQRLKALAQDLDLYYGG